MVHSVFVYGTLQKGCPNYHLLDVQGEDASSVTFIGKGLTVETKPLVIASTYNIPFMLDKTGSGMRIYGEVYEVDDLKFVELDKLENHPNLYVRQEIQIQMLLDEGEPTDKMVQAWCYILPNFLEELLSLQFIDRYSIELVENLGRPYVPRPKREVQQPVELLVKKQS